MWRLRKKTGTELSLPSGQTVRIYLDPDVDAATVVVSDKPVARTVRVEGAGLVDLDQHGNVVALELLSVSKQIEEQRVPPVELEAPVSDLLNELRKAVDDAKTEREKTAS
jgi:uncharacterized protein YuzE